MSRDHTERGAHINESEQAVIQRIATCLDTCPSHGCIHNKQARAGRFRVDFKPATMMDSAAIYIAVRLNWWQRSRPLNLDACNATTRMSVLDYISERVVRDYNEWLGLQDHIARAALED